MRVLFFIIPAMLFSFRMLASTPALDNNSKVMTVKEFISLSPKDFETLTGKKLNFLEKAYFKIHKKKLKRLVRKGKLNSDSRVAALDTDDMNIGGLVLGLLLGPIGVLIAYLIEDDIVVKWAWIGFGVWLIIGLIVILI